MQGHRVRTLVCFAVPERLVDQLLEAVVATYPAATRCVVAGLDAVMLGALVEQWARRITLTVVLLPHASDATAQAVLDVLSNENLALDEVVWLHGTKECEAPDSLHFTALLEEQAGLHVLAKRVVRLQGQVE
jgi:hypothetical protein